MITDDQMIALGFEKKKCFNKYPPQGHSKYGWYLHNSLVFNIRRGDLDFDGEDWDELQPSLKIHQFKFRFENIEELISCVGNLFKLK